MPVPKAFIGMPVSKTFIAWSVVKATGGYTFIQKVSPSGRMIDQYAFQFDQGDAARLASRLNQLEKEIIRLRLKLSLTSL
jgi:hypothetical protein